MFAIYQGSSDRTLESRSMVFSFGPNKKVSCQVNRLDNENNLLQDELATFNYSIPTEPKTNDVFVGKIKLDEQKSLVIDVRKNSENTWEGKIQVREIDVNSLRETITSSIPLGERYIVQVRE